MDAYQPIGTRKCNKCNENKVRLWTKHKDKYGIRLYRDHKGERWKTANCCPDCDSKRETVKDRIKRLGTRECSICKLEKSCIRNPNKHGRTYTCSNGKYWVGTKCPDCYNRFKHLPTVKKGIPQKGLPLENGYELSHRRCRACNELLPKSRYFTHDICAPKASSYISDNEIYC